MLVATHRYHFFAALSLLLVGCFSPLATTQAQSSTASSLLTSESPGVRELIGSAKRFLAASKLNANLGGRALVGLVFLKDDEPSHARVGEALDASLEFAKKGIDGMVSESTIYDLSICTIFLCEFDSLKYRKEIESMMSALWKRQQTGGAFGYLGNPAGDTSMTQYAVLAMWTANYHKIPMDWPAVNKTLEWLIRTQTPEGAWGYHAIDPGKLGARVDQSNIRLSLVAGGLGSVYICADILGLGKRLKGGAKEENKLPAAFKLVEEESGGPEDSTKGNPSSVAAASVTSALMTNLKRCTSDGKTYFKSHFVIPYEKYDHYYLYALERFESFRTQLEKTPSKTPTWYEQGVAWLKETQKKDGSWQGDLDADIDTAFSCLFLMRSTQKSIKASLGQGLLTGGRGLPKDTANIRIRGGKIVGEPLTASPDEIFAILEDPESPDFAALADNPESVMLSGNPGKRAGEVQRLRRLVQTGDVVARRLAVQALGRHREFENVPVLIYALGDSDDEVVRSARDSLRFVSRRFDGFKLPDFPTEDQKAAAIESWKDWYRSVRPGARFLE